MFLALNHAGYDFCFLRGRVGTSFSSHSLISSARISRWLRCIWLGFIGLKRWGFVSGIVSLGEEHKLGFAWRWYYDRGFRKARGGSMLSISVLINKLCPDSKEGEGEVRWEDTSTVCVLSSRCSWVRNEEALGAGKLFLKIVQKSCNAMFELRSSSEAHSDSWPGDHGDYDSRSWTITKGE